MTKYTKPYLTVADQIVLLQKRGMIITNLDAAKSYLSRIGYYRLSAYWYPFRATTINRAQPGQPRTLTVHDHFKPNTHFQTVVDLYVFDKKLRMLVADMLERVEVSLRTEIALQMGAYDPWAHRDAALLNRKFAIHPEKGRSTSKHHEWLRKLDEKAATSKEQYAAHFRTKYDESPVPIWVAVELCDFGPLSHFLSGLRTQDLWAIARKYNVQRPELLARWVRTFCDVRNICAHHARMWNKPLVNEPLPPNKGEIPLLEHLIGDRNVQSRIYSAIATGRYMLRSINPRTGWSGRFKLLVASLPRSAHISEAAMGLPVGWRNLELWR